MSKANHLSFLLILSQTKAHKYLPFSAIWTQLHWKSSHLPLICERSTSMYLGIRWFYAVLTLKKILLITCYIPENISIVYLLILLPNSQHSWPNILWKKKMRVLSSKIDVSSFHSIKFHLNPTVLHLCLLVYQSFTNICEILVPNQTMQ